MKSPDANNRIIGDPENWFRVTSTTYSLETLDVLFLCAVPKPLLKRL